MKSEKILLRLTEAVIASGREISPEGCVKIAKQIFKHFLAESDGYLPYLAEIELLRSIVREVAAKDPVKVVGVWCPYCAATPETEHEAHCTYMRATLYTAVEGA